MLNRSRILIGELGDRGVLVLVHELYGSHVGTYCRRSRAVGLPVWFLN